MEKYGKVIDNDLINNIDNLTERGLTYNTSISEALELINNNVNIEKRYDRKVDFNQFVGWDQQASWNILLDKLFSDYTVKLIQNKTAYYLDGVDKKGRRIMPSENVVETALLGIFRDYRPRTGDIYGKYSVVNPSDRDDYNYIVDMTISFLVREIRNDIEMAQNNEKLTIWTTLLGDFNEHGLRQYPPIKVRNKRPDPMLFHMRY